jgi:hypothetical protein
VPTALYPGILADLVHAVLNDVIGRAGSLGRGVPNANTYHSGRHSVPGISSYPASFFSDRLLGDAYEYLMRHFATEKSKSKGQLYTPAEVSRIMAQVIGIGDAACRKPATLDQSETVGSNGDIGWMK